MSGSEDLTGTWHGSFTYPGHSGPETPFLAIIEERAGSLSGTIVEPDQFYGQGTIDAVIAGSRGGSSVDFTKSYRNGIRGYENPVDYVGRLSGDGMTITGVWSLLEHDGTFTMEREEEVEEPVEAEVTLELPTR